MKLVSSYRSGCLILFVGILIFCSSSVAGQDLNTLEKVQNLKTPRLNKKVTVYYTSGYKSRAKELHSMIDDAVRFYEEKFGLKIELSVAVLSKRHWEQVTGTPYGLPFASDPPYVAFLPATNDGLLTGNIEQDKNNAAIEHLSELRALGFEFEAAKHKGIDLIGLHEVGHIISENLGIGVYPPNPNKWVGEFMASYFAYAFLREKKPKLAKLWFALTRNELATARKQQYTLLSDLEEHYSGVGPENYGWFQSHFIQQAAKVYDAKGFSIAVDLRANPFPDKRTLPIAEVLAHLEKMSPGFIEWSRTMR